MMLWTSKTTKDFAELAVAKKSASSNDSSNIGVIFKANEYELETTIKYR